MQVTVNGTPRELAAGTTVGDLLASLGLQRDGIAVARNRRVVPKSQHSSETLDDGDKVEIIQAVGGG